MAREIDPLITNEELADEIQRRNDATRTPFMIYQTDQEDNTACMWTNLTGEEEIGDMLEFYEEQIKDIFNYDEGEDDS